MPSNIEIKARLIDRAAAEVVAARLSDSGPNLIVQEDVFFHCTGARLKLRILGPGEGELIRYQRSDAAEVRLSRYSIARTSDPEVLRDILSASLETAGVVRKTRTLYLVGRTRIHLDQVEGLGDFLELEVVLGAGQSEEEGKRVASALLAQFGITNQEWESEAYIDLLADRAGAK
jgi:predicted adenylyl cyclase CyaB